MIFQKEMPKVKFHKWNCTLRFVRYDVNDQICIQLFDADDRMFVATATTNVLDAELSSDEVVIKDYSENEGMYNALLDAGIINPSNRNVRTGYTECPVCSLRMLPEKFINSFKNK